MTSSSFYRPTPLSVFGARCSRRRIIIPPSLSVTLHLFEQKCRTPLPPATVNSADADLVVQAQDGVRFNLHRRYLEVTTGAFPGAEFDSRGEVTHLTETSTVLALLFQFVYPQKHPDLREVDFDTVAGVAEAAEKYEVFAAMNICQLRMREFLPEHAAEILAHAIKHDYYGLIDEVIPHLARQPPVRVLEKLPLSRALAWSRYQEAWNIIFLKVILHIRKLPSNNNYDYCLSQYSWDPDSIHYICAACRYSLLEWVLDVQTLDTLSDLNTAIQNYKMSPTDQRSSPSDHLCKKCKPEVYCPLKKQISELLQDEIKKIPPFKSFL